MLSLQPMSIQSSNRTRRLTDPFVSTTGKKTSFVLHCLGGSEMQLCFTLTLFPSNLTVSLKLAPRENLTWLAGTSTMNEDAFPIENVFFFPASHVSLQGCEIWLMDSEIWFSPRCPNQAEGGSSKLGYVVNNHGDRFCPRRIGVWDPFQMAFLWLINRGN